MACVAWLHDTAEDTDLSIQNIRLEGFGGAICDAIQLLTHDKSVSYMDYVRQVAKNPIARAVKLADLRDSMDTSRLDRVDETVEKQLAEYREAYRFLSGEQD